MDVHLLVLLTLYVSRRMWKGLIIRKNVLAQKAA
jgi:hypothetical protein